MTRLAITPGEPAGIGPDLMVYLAQSSRAQDWVAFADADMLKARAECLGISLNIDHCLERPAREAGRLTVSHVPLGVEVQPGVLNQAAVPGLMQALDDAIDACGHGDCAGLVTGPMQKSIVNEAGLEFSGHTEYLAARAGVEDVVMLLVAGELRVALATTHLPLKDVSAALSRTVLSRRLRILDSHLRKWFGIASPRILVAGLNPHAGEQGHLGHEEIETITPVCAALADEGVNVVGPLPADTLFTPQYLENADAVMAMYHDQGLPVLKYAGFGAAVNVTLGLPFVRTSVDHGTALDLAGKPGVSASSMAAALQLAAHLAAGV